MLHPLASLWRHPNRVSFYESAGMAGHIFSRNDGLTQASAMAERRRFTSAEDAFDYLRYWSGRPDARAELKWILARAGPSMASAHAGADGWLRALAGSMAAGAVVVMEERRRSGVPGRLVAPPSAGASDDAIASLPLLDAMPSAPATAAEAPARADDDTPMVTAAEWPAAIDDQIAQAETLEAAARDGTPFCEICG